MVIASWYGKKPVALALGTRFHRSHIEVRPRTNPSRLSLARSFRSLVPTFEPRRGKLVASQVSAIAGAGMQRAALKHLTWHGLAWHGLA